MLQNRHIVLGVALVLIVLGIALVGFGLVLLFAVGGHGRAAGECDSSERDANTGEECTAC
jgi:hypothetical protein